MVEINRTWIIGCPQSGCSIDFDGIIAVNSSNQKVLSVITEPQMRITAGEDGEIHALYSGPVRNGTLELKASVIVETDYDTALMEDPPIVRQNITSTPLIEWNADIAAKADELAEPGSTLGTLRNTAAWVHDNIEYDISYFEEKTDAKMVYVERRGVCVEYSHLLISMVNSLGIKTRYVNGYVVADDWQPHAWIEAYVPDYGWLPLDPTFNEAGVLDSSHVMVSYGYDQETDFDRLVANSDSATLERLPTKITLISERSDPKGLSVTISFENRTYTATTETRNGRADYVFALYSFYPPEGYGSPTSELLLISPHQSVNKNHPLDPTRFSEGYAYTLPMAAYANDASDKKTAVLVMREEGSAGAGGETCVPAFILALALLGAVIKFTDE
ncbi:transglutaminase domain-containing protein [Candidatus Micrarchaeota archaeon]|nr:transglutaminase domain-containing protein [Candidatus Micrarchaeota archaeon]